jgi:prolipoprotein diacylglyceryltransferase
VTGLFQPTFLYESVWDISLALILIWVSRRWRLGSGQLFAIYVMGYTAGRGWIEALRHDHANHILGLRLNDWTSIVVLLFGVALLLWRRRTHHEAPYLDNRSEEPVSART